MVTMLPCLTFLQNAFDDHYHFHKAPCMTIINLSKIKKISIFITIFLFLLKKCYYICYDMQSLEIDLHRLSIFTADLQRINGKSLRACQRHMQAIRDMFDLQKEQPVTIFHVAEYLDTPVSKVASFLGLVKRK